MRMGSAFAGIGGFELGFEPFATPVWQSEIDEHACAVLEHRFPQVPNVGDIRGVEPNDDLEPIDLLVGGFPCQDTSKARGARAGLRGEQSGLFWEFARLIHDLGPRWVVLENPPGLLRSNGGRDMASVVGTLGELGYGWAYRVLDALCLGVPQRRRRIFFVAHLGSTPRAAAVLHEPKGGTRDLGAGTAPPGQSPGQDAAADLGGGAYGGRGSVGAFRKTRRAQSNEDYEAWEAGQYANTLNRFDGSDTRATNLVVECYPNPAQTLTKRHGKGINTTVDDGTVVIERGDPGLDVRRLTPRECERLQGFPDDWTSVPWRTLKSGEVRMMPDSARYALVGNAVAVPVMRWIARRMVQVEGALEGQ